MIFAIVFGTILGFFVFYQAGLTILSIVASARRATSPPRDGSTRFAILIPAHNEELLIGALIESIRRSNYPSSQYEVFVIADNCTDRTADIARTAGANCLERTDDENRGKPYALQWALDTIQKGKFDAFSIIDADTTVHPDYFAAMSGAICRGEDAIQGYFGVLNPDENWLTRLSILPGTLRYKLQCPGKAMLGLSCPLAGNGMVFSAAVIQQFGWNAFSIAENWEYFVILTLAGYTVYHDPNAVIYSQVANTLKEGRPQRVRWLKGRVDTISRYGKELILEAFNTGKVVFLDCLVELVRPSHSMLFLGCIVYLALCTLGWSLIGLPQYLFLYSLSLVVILMSIYVCGLVVEKAPLKTWLSLGMVPIYLAWKLVVSLGGLVSLRDRSWVKTKRH
jgi:1,2-diacylglycerol 3-beta-glucosyltransferase